MDRDMKRGDVGSQALQRRRSSLTVFLLVNNCRSITPKLSLDPFLKMDFDFEESNSYQIYRTPLHQTLQRPAYEPTDIDIVARLDIGERRDALSIFLIPH